MKTMIAIPCMDMVHTAFVQSLMRMDMKPLGQTHIQFHTGSLIYDSRNLLALMALKEGYDYIFWLDSDMTVSPEIAKEFMETMQWTGADLVSGVYFKRRKGGEPVLYSRIEPPAMDSNGEPVSQIDTAPYVQNEVFPIAGCGFGAVLTKTSLFRSIMDANLGMPFTPLPWASEDISFCYRARKAGGKMVADSRVRIGHIGQYVFTADDYIKQGD